MMEGKKAEPGAETKSWGGGIHYQNRKNRGWKVWNQIEGGELGRLLARHARACQPYFVIH